MRTIKFDVKNRLIITIMALAIPLSATADEQYDLLKEQVTLLQQQLEQVQKTLAEYQQQSDSNLAVAKDVADLKVEVAEAAAWKRPNTLIHMSGYADVGYSSSDNSDGSFNVGTFSPIFHFQYRDIVMLESELEFEVTDGGDTEVALEYLTIDYFLNDYVALLGGKFLSPIGQFRQNFHPSWINKLASAPPGFGHDGAAPVSEVGFQARGGFPVGDMFANYAVYVSNGPQLLSVLEDGEFELEGVEAEGFGSDTDGDKAFGGRFGFLPLPGLEIGFSLATGRAAVTGIEAAHGEEEEEEHDEPVEGEHDEPGEIEPEFVVDFSNEPSRTYDVIGADFAWALNDFAVRGEYVRTKIGADDVGLTASPGAVWKSFYLQGSYVIPETKWETALRYTDFDSPHASQDQKQWAVGLNYLFTSSVMAKLSYEFNDGQSGSMADLNRWMFQLAYGF